MVDEPGDPDALVPRGEGRLNRESEEKSRRLHTVDADSFAADTPPSRRCETVSCNRRVEGMLLDKARDASSISAIASLPAWSVGTAKSPIRAR